MVNPFDISQLSLSHSRIQSNKKSTFPLHRRKEKFLKGPIPWEWLCKAAQQPGKALQVALAVRHLTTLKRCSNVKLSANVLAELGVKRHAGYRGLKKLEDEGLVFVTRHSGRNPIVQIHELAAKDQ